MVALLSFKIQRISDTQGHGGGCKQQEDKKLTGVEGVQALKAGALTSCAV